MKQIIFSLLLLVTFASCNKNSSGSDELEGTYKGTFQRQILGAGEVSHVTITFQDGKYEGESDKPMYPALCKGNYSINKGKGIFENKCYWTANFDWTLILNGDYQVTRNGNQLLIVKQYGNESKDIYTLVKQ